METKNFYKLLRNYHPEGGINQVYVKWGVDVSGKKRKQKLLSKMYTNNDEYDTCVEYADLLTNVGGIHKACEENANTSKKFKLKEFDEFMKTATQSVNEKAKVSKGSGCTIL